LSYKLLAAEDVVEEVEEAQLFTLKLSGGEIVTVCSIYRGKMMTGSTFY
jgi:hypothetical protein